MAQHELTTIRFRIRASRYLLAWLLVSHVAAWAALAALQGPWIWRLPLALAVTASLVAGLRRHLLQRGPGGLRRLHWRADGRWLVEGRRKRGRLLSAAQRRA